MDMGEVIRPARRIADPVVAPNIDKPLRAPVFTPTPELVPVRREVISALPK